MRRTRAWQRWAWVTALGVAACSGGDRVPAARAEARASAASPSLDSAPSVVPVPGTDTNNPEFDSLKAAARRAGAPEALLPSGLPSDPSGSRPAEAAAADASTALPAGAASVPLVTGLRIVSTLAFPDGDRENVVAVRVGDDGVLYSWHLRQQVGGKVQQYDLKRIVRPNDLTGAPRLDDVVGTEGPDVRPGYTFASLSQATYRTLRAGGKAPFTVVGMDGGLLGGAMAGVGASRVTYKGVFTVVSPTPEPMPVLLDGRRTSLPALHLDGKFAFQDQRMDGEFWVLADSLHPLILKEVHGKDVLQVVRIDRPVADDLEAELAKDCRAELPGIYFAFGSAELDPASAPGLERVGAMLKRHADWTLGIEGHTDSVGNVTANQKLSQQRADAVRTALVSGQGIPAARLAATGFGATRPRESNASVEGRARNRRVELVRACAGTR